jgi:VanZ family protein
LGPFLLILTSGVILHKPTFLKKTSFLLAVTWLIISTILLTIPGTKFPKDDWLSKIWFDKWVHIGLFALLVFLWCWFLFSRTIDHKKLSAGFLLIAITGLAYGATMELVQKYFVVNRSFDGGDIIADGIGCILGLLLARGRYIKK